MSASNATTTGDVPPSEEFKDTLLLITASASGLSLLLFLFLGVTIEEAIKKLSPSHSKSYFHMSPRTLKTR
jgi:hypothetical protein